jgi:hypothetical protein
MEQPELQAQLFEVSHIRLQRAANPIMSWQSPSDGHLGLSIGFLALAIVMLTAIIEIKKVAFGGTMKQRCEC